MLLLLSMKPMERKNKVSERLLGPLAAQLQEVLSCVQGIEL